MSKKASPKKIETGGGAYIEGKVNISGGDFVGRDQYSTTGVRVSEISHIFEKFFFAIEAKQGLSEIDK